MPLLARLPYVVHRLAVTFDCRDYWEEPRYRGMPVTRPAPPGIARIRMTVDAHRSHEKAQLNRGEPFQVRIGRPGSCTQFLQSSFTQDPVEEV